MQPIYRRAERLGIARAVVIRAYREYFTAGRGLYARPSKLGFVRSYNAGWLPAARDAKRTLPTIDRASLRRWLLLSPDGRPDQLKPRWHGQTITLFDRHPAVRAAVEEVLAVDPQASAGAVLLAAARRLRRRRLPSLRTIQRYMKRRLRSQ